MATESRRRGGMRIPIHPGCQLLPVKAENDGPRQPKSAATARPCVVSSGGRPNEGRGSRDTSKHARERVLLEQVAKFEILPEHIEALVPVKPPKLCGMNTAIHACSERATFEAGAAEIAPAKTGGDRARLNDLDHGLRADRVRADPRRGRRGGWGRGLARFVGPSASCLVWGRIWRRRTCPVRHSAAMVRLNPSFRRFVAGGEAPAGSGPRGWTGCAGWSGRWLIKLVLRRG